ncbi:MAG TPA: hypothetical protein VL354_09085 [Spirochaetia bacterium]|nr:hypothetical protein [Spirochaetia bacterium]
MLFIGIIGLVVVSFIGNFVMTVARTAGFAYAALLARVVTEVRIAVLLPDPNRERSRARPGTEDSMRQGLRRFEATARAVSEALEAGGHSIVPMPVNSRLSRQIGSAGPDLVFNTYFGPARREDQSHVASLLEYLGTSFSGGAAACHFVGLSKPLSKAVFAGSGLRTAPFFLASSATEAVFRLEVSKLAFPLIVKASGEGEGIGLDQRSVVQNRDELERAVERVVAGFGAPALVEKLLPGREFTVGVLAAETARVLPVMEITLKQGHVYSYEEKVQDSAGAICPAYPFAHRRGAAWESRRAFRDGSSLS